MAQYDLADGERFTVNEADDLPANESTEIENAFFDWASGALELLEEDTNFGDEIKQ